METVLLTVVFVFSLFLMCGGCASEDHGRRGERWERDRHSERSDQDMDRTWRSREPQHDERR
jgi:hypothetical protein